MRPCKLEGDQASVDSAKGMIEEWLRVDGAPRKLEIASVDTGDGADHRIPIPLE